MSSLSLNVMPSSFDALHTTSRAAAQPARHARAACEQRHRPFFLAALALALTLGATWGAMLLWRIGMGGSFTAVSIHDINAHGQAQIYGWVGLFIMGFAYTFFPRMWRSPAPSRALGLIVLCATVAGVLLTTIGMRLGGAWPLASHAALAGAVLVILGVLLFAAQMLNSFERRRAPAEPAFLFMLVALAWFVLSAVFNAAHVWMTTAAPDHDHLIEVIGTYQAALRDVQIHGLALTMILGVSLKILPGIFGLPRISHRRALLALALITLGVAGETSFFIAFRWSGVTAFAGVLYVCWLLLAAGVGTILLAWRPCFGLPRDDRRSGKFIRAAYVWLGVSMLLLLLLPLYQALVHLPFSHAFYGATRHAITVGFISMMIMGVSAKFVSGLAGPGGEGIPWSDLSALRGPFLLVNIGCGLRVILQIATDITPTAFNLVGFSGVLEVAGLVWWGAILAGQLVRRRTSAPISYRRPGLPATPRPLRWLRVMSASLPTCILIDQLNGRNRTCAEQPDPPNRA